MKINSISSVNSQTPLQKSRQTSFQAGIPPKATDQAVKKMPWLAKALMYVGQNDGEILNTLVTAFGTAVIAPLFIAGNPISKEEKETKWYSAMRQPISAIIAMVMQIGVNSSYNNYMNQQASLGKLGEHMDLRANPSANYLRRIIKLEHPDYDGKQISDEIAHRQHMSEKVELVKLRKAMEGQEVKLTDLLDYKILEEAEDEIKAELEKQYETQIQGMRKKKATSFIKEKITDEMVQERALKNIEKDIEFETQVKFTIRELKKKFANIEGATMDMAIDEIKAQQGQMDDKLIKRIVEKLSDAKVYETGNGKKPFSSFCEYLGDNSYENVKHNVKVKRLLKSKAIKAERFFGKTKNCIGIIVSLVTLPISCGLLNWAYPRVMEKVMPKIQPYIHRKDTDWTPEKAKKYGPQPKVEKVFVKVVEEAEHDKD